jgi:hypothetical protein
MPDQQALTDMGGTMRLGNYPCVLQPGTQAQAAYGMDEIQERHRHRFEFNNAYRELLGEAGLVYSGLSPDGRPSVDGRDTVPPGVQDTPAAAPSTVLRPHRGGVPHRRLRPHCCVLGVLDV